METVLVSLLGYVIIGCLVYWGVRMAMRRKHEAKRPPDAP
jgi:hypothetical protein